MAMQYELRINKMEGSFTGHISHILNVLYIQENKNENNLGKSTKKLKIHKELK